MALTSSIRSNCSALSVFDENFGMGMDFNNIKRQFREWVEKQSTSYPVATSNDSAATVSTLNDKFQVTIDVYQFKSEEITIKVVGSNTICIEGNHEEQHEDCGFLSRHFMRKYTLPNGYDIKNVVSTLSSDGILRIIAPRNGETNDDYRNISIQQTGSSLQTKKQTQYKEENVQKSLSGYHEVPVQRKNVDQEVSLLQNQQTHSKKESNVSVAQSTKDFEEIHNNIQEFLRSIDNRCKVVPIRPVGPFTNPNEHETKFDINTTNLNSHQTQETYKKQKECHTVPIQQTTATYASSFETETKKQTDSSHTPKSQYPNIPINQMKVCDARTTESSNEIVVNKQQNRKCSIDTEEKYVQKEVIQEYRTIPIQQTGKQSQNTSVKSITEQSKTQNWENSTTKSNPSQEYKIPIEQTRAQTKDKIQEETFRKHNTIEVEETKIRNEQRTQDAAHTYKNIPIQQTGISSQVSKDEIRNEKMFKKNSIDSQCETDFETTASRERYINKTQNLVDTSLVHNIIPIEQIREDKNSNNIKKTMTREESNKQEIYEQNYKTIPIKQIEVTSQETCEKKMDSQRTTQNTTDFECNINKKQNITNTSQEPKIVPTEQAQEHKFYDKHSNDANNTVRNVKTIEEIETWEIHNNMTPIISQVSRNETREQKVFKNSSIDSQCNAKNTTDFEETENWECVNKKQSLANTSQEHKTIPIQQTRPDKFQEHKEVNDTKRNVELMSEEKTMQNEKETRNYKTIPAEQTDIVTQVTKHETHEQKMFKTSSIDSQRNITDFEETENWERNLNKTQNTSLPGEGTTNSSKVSYEQELYTNNLTSANNTNKKSNKTDVFEQLENASNYSQNTEIYSNSSKTNEGSSKKLLQSSNTDEHLGCVSDRTQINKQSTTQATKEQNVSSLQSNLAQKNELSTLQNQQNNLVFQESDSSKENFIRDGYKQSSLTNKNAKAEFVALPQGFKMTNEQSFYAEQTKTKEWNNNKNEKQVDQAQNNAYQVQFSVDSSSGERFSRMPSETSEICIEEITEENEAKTRSGGSTGYRRHETSQFVSNSDHSVHVQQN